MTKIAVILILLLLVLTGVLFVMPAKSEPHSVVPRTMLQEAMPLYAQGNVGKCRDLLKIYCEGRPDEKDARLFYARVRGDGARQGGGAGDRTAPKRRMGGDGSGAGRRDHRSGNRTA
jgi:hypothetical protein